MLQFPFVTFSVRPIQARIALGLAVLAAGLTVAINSAYEPPPQGVFHTGATSGLVRDATKVGNIIYAVGTWTNSGAGGRFDGALWTFDGANPAVRTALPDISSNTQNLAAGDAITPDAAYIANQVRVTSNPPTAARVAFNPLTSTFTNLDLMPAATYASATYSGRQARTVSDNGSIVYGQASKWLGLFNPNSSKLFQGRAMRFDISGLTVTATEIYPQPVTITVPNDPTNYPTFQSVAARAASSDGAVVLGSTFSGAPVTDTRAFRYVHGTGVTNISLLPGGTWNAPVALSDNGNIVVAVGPSTQFPNREVFLADFTSGSEVITRLGSPNEAWGFGAGGITADGSVVAITSTTGCSPNVCRYGYFHNSNGWFQLTSAMAASGMDITDWERFQIQGISADGKMVWGSGLHNGAEEGYVAEFPADFLKNFDVVAAPPADPSIVGVWAPDAAGSPATSAPEGIIAFMRDGTYYTIADTGLERGVYTYDGSAMRATTLQDQAGDDGLSDLNGMAAPIGIVGDELRSPANCVFDSNNPDECFVAHRINNAAGTLQGGWVIGEPANADSSAVIVFTSSGRYLMAQDGDAAEDPSGADGVEIGTYEWNAVTGVITIPAPASVDTNGEWGLSDPIGAITATLSADELAMEAGDSAGSSTFTRIVNPQTVLPSITSPLTANGTATEPFSYTITATRGLTFAVQGAGWLSANPSTGVLSGTPPAPGIVPVTISATNTFGDIDSETLVLTIGTPLNPPGAFGRISPLNGASRRSASPTLMWGASTGASSYEYCIDTTNDSACSGWTSTGSVTSVALNGLNPSTPYYWHIRAHNGDGTTYANGSSTTFWSFTTASATAPPLLDLDGDDIGDVFAHDPSSGEWWRELSQAGGGFEEGQGNWDANWSVLPARFDADKRTDVFLFNTTTGAWARMLNNGTGFTTQATGGWWPGWQRHALDLNGDGITDFFLYDPATGVWFQCVSTPGGFNYTQGGWDPNWEIHPMRLNADAFGDLFLISRTTGRWFWVLGDGANGFTYPVSETWFPGWVIYPGDFNGDGLTDFLLHDPPTGIYFVAATGPSGFTYTQGGWSLGWTPWVADLNGDGTDDLFLHDPATGNWFQMISNGAGGFTNVGGETWSLGWTLHVSDFNGDGRADLLLYHPVTGVWYQARNLTPGVFTYSTGTWNPGLTALTGVIWR